MSILAVIQARVGSTRLPGKVLLPLAGIPVLTHVIRRVCATETQIRVCLAIPDTPENDELERIGLAEGVLVYRGQEHDVLARFWGAAQLVSDADAIVRITGEDWAKDPMLIDLAVSAFLQEWAEPTTELPPPHLVWLGGPSWPLGCDAEVFSRQALDTAHQTATLAEDREHVTLWIKRNLGAWVIRNPFGVGDATDRWTLDVGADYAMAVKAYDRLYAENPVFGFEAMRDAGLIGGGKT